jgi:hypothetical protein
MDVEGDVEALKKSYNAEWVKCTDEAQQGAVSSVYCYFLNFAEFDIL